MDITITEIKETKIENIKQNTYIKDSFSHLNEKVKINTNTEIKIDLVKIIYIKLFKEPIDGIYDIKKIKVIEKHLKHNNLI